MIDKKEIKVRKDAWDIVDYITSVFVSSIELGASDIHIEETKTYVQIRFRKDGDFIIHDRLDHQNYSALITRLKVLSRIKIDENKKPQDGKISFYYEKEKEDIDVRLSTFPTKYGEKVVMRLLRQDESLINIDKLGFIDVNLHRIKEALKSKYGIILVAWPTGSGKSTTLFWVLKHFNPLEYNISTLEDPIEYDMDFVNQSQMYPDIWYSFAEWLRSLMRQDPDIIMVWEIRDKETSMLAVEAALTGHIVFSTIHTNSAAGTVQRLINMDIEPFLIASALKMVISQRLGKRLCPDCKIVDDLWENKLSRIKEYLWDVMDESEIESIVFYKWQWCKKCGDTGYKWRVWIHEVLISDEWLEELVLGKSSVWEMLKWAQEHGMITIVQDALLKAAIGETTVEEAFKLI